VLHSFGLCDSLAQMLWVWGMDLDEWRGVGAGWIST